MRPLVFWRSSWSTDKVAGHEKRKSRAGSSTAFWLYSTRTEYKTIAKHVADSAALRRGWAGRGRSSSQWWQRTNEPWTVQLIPPKMMNTYSNYSIKYIQVIYYSVLSRLVSSGSSIPHVTPSLEPGDLQLISSCRTVHPLNQIKNEYFGTYHLIIERTMSCPSVTHLGPCFIYVQAVFVHYLRIWRTQNKRLAMLPKLIWPHLTSVSNQVTPAL